MCLLLGTLINFKNKNMPTLNWIGKDKVINHHLDVPIRSLETVYTDGTSRSNREGGVASENKIIHGDNLEALKALLPMYEGKIKCIYIDPPYNTGNEKWVYNDNVNDPKIKKWLGQVVGKESEDLSRHDKWLCMMYPRLQLLRKLLADDGAIFISIDDNEHSHLKLLCDEIFGNGNYLTSFVWKRRSGSNDAKNFLSVDHEYVVAYQKTNSCCLNGIVKPLENYINPDKDPRGLWTRGDLTCNKTKDERPNLYYDIIDPDTGITYSANSNRVWVYEKERMQRMIDAKKVIFPKTEKGTPQYKRHISELRNLSKPVSSWIFPSNSKENFIGISSSINSIATKELRNIFDNQIFDYPKPIDLIEGLISQISDLNSVILDSFAGSGTTAHAVLNLNKQDGGNRKFILIEMEDYAETITAERVRRVIKGYGDKEGTGGDFQYCALGERLFDEEGQISENANIEALRAYVFYSETKTALLQQNKEPYFLGEHEGVGYYFYYEKEKTTSLDYDFLRQINISAKTMQYVIYADNCLLSDEFMQQHQIIFKKIASDIAQL
jgi:adenine-specific DNA-methyltransferase